MCSVVKETAVEIFAVLMTVLHKLLLMCIPVVIIVDLLLVL